MTLPTIDRLGSELGGLDPALPDYASRAVEAALSAARAAGASDVHWQPTPRGLELKFRVDGVLLPVALFPRQLAANLIARLKVRAELLTYHTDRPQEGRIRLPQADNLHGSCGAGGPAVMAGGRPAAGGATENPPAHAGDAPQPDVEMRVSTFPTLHGERAVVRLFGGSGRYQRLDDLGLPEDVRGPLETLLAETSGAILVSGPAGSGKTTTLYACLRQLTAATGGQRSLVSIEDPIEVAVAGVAQSQVHAAAGLDLAVGLRFLMRQDPEVIMVGEIRDRPTAEAALQASLTGHLVLSTFHAGSAAETVGRLLDMGIEPYVLRSGLLAILNQRLLRRLCTCAEETDDADARLGLPVRRVKIPRGCQACHGTGYQGRFLLVEMLTLARSGGAADLGRAILSRSDAATIEQLAVGQQMTSRWERACRAVQEGLTSPAEVRRLLGFSPPPADVGKSGSPH
jgi:type II secretory ATPase GspE/PulE/Tfp pilus assembly ATPase PilB-like protein